MQNKEKVNNLVLFDKATYDKLLAEVPKYKMITQVGAAGRHGAAGCSAVQQWRWLQLGCRRSRQRAASRVGMQGGSAWGGVQVHSSGGWEPTEAQSRATSREQQQAWRMLQLAEAQAQGGLQG